MSVLDELIQEGVTSRIFGAARAYVLHRGRVAFDGGTVPADAQFDLASVTKVVCTTALVTSLARAGRLDVHAPVSSVLPSVRVQAAIADLAFHRSGLPAFRPYFAQVAQEQPSLFSSRTAELAATVRSEVVARVAATDAERPVGSSAVYSDLGFILLGEVVSAAAKQPLDALFAREIAEPLGLSAGFRRLSTVSSDSRVVSTGGSRPREPAPGQEGMWSTPSWPSRDGDVDDDNAWVMDGVAGHAGLFGSARDVATFGQAVLEGRFESPVGWARDAVTPGSTRAFGFDTPSIDAPSCGSRFGRGPRGAIGHLGFTGTSLWIDFERELVVALLTNRVVFGRANLQIRAFRPRFHDAVFDLLGL